MEKLLSNDFYKAMEALVPRYPTKVALLLPAFHKAQEEKGWLSSETLHEIAEFIGIHPAQAKEVASFYNMYHLKPVGKYVIRICTNVSCALRGAEKLVEHCEKKYGVKPGETSPDKKFTLIEEECLGACGTAPTMMLNEKYVENLNPESFDRALEGCK